MWQWIAGLAGLGIVGYGLKSRADKQPRPGDVALVPFSALLVPGLAAGAVNPLLAFGQGQIPVTIKTVMPADILSGIVGAGIPVTFNGRSILALSRAGVPIT
jgi:hypothetical protein